MKARRTLKIPSLSYRVWKTWRRDRDVFMRTYKVSFIPPFLEPLLYLGALGFGLGVFIKEINGVSYAAFIAPALLSIAMMFSSFFETTFGSYVRMYYQKTFDAIIATPVNIEEVVAGEILWGATKSAIYASLMLVVIALLGLVQLPQALLVPPFAFLAGLMFGAIGMICTSLVPAIEFLNYPIYLFITPMFLFSGTFFPMTVFPEIVQFMAFALMPLAHVVRISRGLTLGKLEPMMGLSLLWMLVVTAVLFVVSINLMRKRLIV